VFNADVLGSNADENGPPLLLSSNQQLLLPPGDLSVVADAVVTAVVGAPNKEGKVPVTVSATATAVLVTLTTLESGVFSDNVFLLTPQAPIVVLFTSYAGPVDAKALRASLRVVHLAQYL
tara:strand:- start:112 stop:471 length:360 start_codon:yes stop_codon:yes gene_type:complete